MTTTCEEQTSADLMRIIKFNEDQENIYCLDIAWEAVWHFFIGGDDDFEKLYERGITETREEAEGVYLCCSEWLFDNEFAIARMLDEGDSKQLVETIIRPLATHLEEVYGQTN